MMSVQSQHILILSTVWLVAWEWSWRIDFPNSAIRIQRELVEHENGENNIAYTS
jgi:hypothetical protein